MSEKVFDTDYFHAFLKQIHGTDMTTVWRQCKPSATVIKTGNKMPKLRKIKYSVLLTHLLTQKQHIVLPDRAQSSPPPIISN
jgi:hypothetical protein